MGSQNLGGFPHQRTFSVPTTGISYAFPGATIWVDITVSDNAVKIYQSQEDADAQVNALDIAASDKLSGPYQMRRVWIVGVVGTATIKFVVALRT